VELVEGLRAEAERAGVMVFEQSPVERLEQAGAGVRVRSTVGWIDATRVVLATSAYTHRLLPTVIRRFIPLYDYILVSEPFIADQRDAIGWRGLGHQRGRLLRRGRWAAGQTGSHS
jgi:glycine/D-amino acid oxidase-like deaminating enzyme